MMQECRALKLVEIICPTEQNGRKRVINDRQACHQWARFVPLMFALIYEPIFDSESALRSENGYANSLQRKQQRYPAKIARSSPLISHSISHSGSALRNFWWGIRGSG